MSSPRISVIITAYNRKEYLDKAIESVIRQDMDHSMFEVILVTNFEFNLGHYLSDVSISSIVMDGTIGEFLYAGIKLAKFDLIAFLDDDDEWENKKLSQVLSVFRSNVNVDYYHNEVTYVNRYGKLINYYRLVENRFQDNFSGALELSASDDTYKLRAALKRNGDFNLSCIVVKKESIKGFIEFLKNIEGATDSFFFWSSYISDKRLFIDPRKLTKYRVHQLNTASLNNLERKVSEIARQIRTFYLLLDYMDENTSSITHKDFSRKWIFMIRLEYEMIQLIFLNAKRIDIVKKIKSLLGYGMKFQHTMKYRLLLFSLIYTISPSLSILIYRKFEGRGNT